MTQKKNGSAPVIEAKAETRSVREMREEIARQEQAEMQGVIRDLQERARQLGYEIFAVPQLSANGAQWGVIAHWGVKRIG